MLAPRLPLGPSGLLLLLLLLQPPPAARPEPQASCDPQGCYALYAQPRSFLEAWRACRELGGNLATLKRAEEAAQVSQLLAGSRQPGPPRLFWIGLQRQPRQCFPQRPLRGFSWVTGEQETAYSNWARAGGAGSGGGGGAGCAAPRCVGLDDRDFEWLEGSCAGPVDGYLCRFASRGMCAGLEEGESGGAAVSYAAPFGPLGGPAAAPPRYVPFGAVATVSCPGGASLSLLCLQKEDGRVAWSKGAPLCRERASGAAAAAAAAASWCEGDNGGCQQLCLDEGSGYACECHAGYALLPDGHSCVANNPCRHRPCQFDCVPEEDAGGGYRCRCPAGYELAADGHQCEDLDECADGPCEHQCENTEGSFLCRCHLGFSPSEEEPGQCADTDECQIPGVCQQMCVNYVGGFECYCTEGFDLEADGISCSPVDALGLPAATPPDIWADPFQVRFTTRRADDLSAPPVRFSLFREAEAGSSSSDSAASFLSVPDRLVFPPRMPATAAPELDNAWDSRVSPLEHGPSSPGLREALHPTTPAADPPTPTGSLPLAITGALPRPPEAPADPAEPSTRRIPLTSPQPLPPRGSSPEDGKEDPVVGGVRAPLPTFASPSPASGEEQGWHRRDDRWLLVALLVPISVFLVIMLALGIVYCTRCGAHAKSRSVTHCYRWVISTSEKTAPPPSSRLCQPATCRTSV